MDHRTEKTGIGLCPNQPGSRFVLLHSSAASISTGEEVPGIDYNEGMTHHTKQTLIQMLRLGAGVILAVGIAHEAGLSNSYSAGTIALITLLTSKRESLRQSVWRIVTFFITAGITFLTGLFTPYPIITFGLTVMLLYLICEKLDILPVLAVNGVICAHFVTMGQFSWGMLLDEFLMVLTGVASALVCGQIYSGKNARAQLRRRMKRDDRILADWLSSLADQLGKGSVALPELAGYERQLKEDLCLAVNYTENSYAAHAEYFAEYFEMRIKQVEVLKNLEWELANYQVPPAQSQVITEFIRYLARYVCEMNEPTAQETQLQRLLQELRHETLPRTREEFEHRAILYHILMTIREFISLKRQFVDGLSEKQKEAYWRQDD